MSLIPYSGDQFGYYTVGPHFKTYSKILAIEEMARTGVHLEWHFNRSTYAIHDWTREPKQSLGELYRQRAQQIRDQYDYVVIWYSGGADSWCVLDSFIQNDIKIDEIAHFHSYSADSDKHSYLNEEVFYTADPKTKQIMQDRPWIRQRLVDLSQLITDVYMRPDMKFDHVYNVKGLASANMMARGYLRDYIADYRSIIDSGKKMCFVWGSEKPRVINIDGQYHVMFLDAFSDTNVRVQTMADSGYFDEWFFWGPTCMDLVAKQCHVLKRALDWESVDSHRMSSTRQLSHIPQSKTTGLFMTNDFYHEIIYPGWDPATLVQPKSKNSLISERDTWFWKQSTNINPGSYVAHQGLRELRQKLPAYWMNDPTDLTKGIKNCRNVYPLE